VLAGCSRPPCPGDFLRCTVPNGVSAYTAALGGRRLTHAVGLAAFSVCCSSWRPQHGPPPATPVNRRAAHTSASIIFSHRPTVALQPLSASSSPPVRTLRRCATSRFATACTAHHGSFLPCSPVPLRCQRRCAGVCRPKRGHPCRPAQHLLQPTALSLRFSISACADYLAAPRSRTRRAAAERHRSAA
jgi:hypothetical protein